MTRALCFFALVLLAACGGQGQSSNSNSITGAVTNQRWEAVRPGSDHGNLSFLVTTNAQRQIANCYIKVKWLDADGMQLAYAFAASDVTIPAGTSTHTDQTRMVKSVADRIVRSSVEYICN